MSGFQMGVGCNPHITHGKNSCRSFFHCFSTCSSKSSFRVRRHGQHPPHAGALGYSIIIVMFAQAFTDTLSTCSSKSSFRLRRHGDTPRKVVIQTGNFMKLMMITMIMSMIMIMMIKMMTITMMMMMTMILILKIYGSTIGV